MTDRTTESFRAAPIEAPAAKDVEFFLIAEAGVLEAQALLLCDSIRQFAGRYAGAAITVVSPRPSARPSAAALRRLEEFGARYLPLDIASVCPEYGPSYKVHAIAELARRDGPAFLVQLDSDTVFLDEPDLALGDSDIAARPVDVKGISTAGPGDPCDLYWRGLCRRFDVDYDSLPLVTATVDGAAIRANFNGGFVVVRRASGVLQRAEELFIRIVSAGLRTHPGVGDNKTSAGMIDAIGSEYRGTSQVALSLAVAGRARSLPPSHNFPLHFFDRLGAPAIPPVHVHYHWESSQPECATNPMLDGRLKLDDGRMTWLRQRLPLRVPEAVEVAGRRLIIVLGMHRSGTSAVTRGLMALGVALGEDLQVSSSDNITGFWEDREVMALNIAVLDALGHEWGDLRPLSPAVLQNPVLTELRWRAEALLRRKLAEHALFGIKDPRLCLLLPFWQTVFAALGLRVSYVVAYRHPMSVAQSLVRRDGFAPERSWYLWLGHVLPALLYTEGMPRVVIDYDRLMDRPAETLRFIANRLDLAIDAAQLATYQRDFLDEGLRHSRYAEGQFAPEVPQLLRDAFALLQRLAEDTSGAARPQETVKPLSRRFDDLGALCDYTMRLESQFDAMQIPIGNYQGASHDLRLRNASLKQTIVDRDAQLAAGSRWLALLEEQHREASGRAATAIAELDRRLAGVTSEMIQLRDRLQARETQFRSQQEEREAQFRARLEEQAAQFRSQSAEQEARLAAESQALAQMRCSQSWRLTAPLRVLFATVRRWAGQRP